VSLGMAGTRQSSPRLLTAPLSKWLARSTLKSMLDAILCQLGYVAVRPLGRRDRPFRMLGDIGVAPRPFSLTRRLLLRQGHHLRLAIPPVSCFAHLCLSGPRLLSQR
jgi:hypothetical protein